MTVMCVIHGSFLLGYDVEIWEIFSAARSSGTLIRPLRGHLPPREGILCGGNLKNGTFRRATACRGRFSFFRDIENCTTRARHAVSLRNFVFYRRYGIKFCREATFPGAAPAGAFRRPTARRAALRPEMEGGTASAVTDEGYPPIPNAGSVYSRRSVFRTKI
jgi:hypothetical protein